MSKVATTDGGITLEEFSADDRDDNLEDCDCGDWNEGFRLCAVDPVTEIGSGSRIRM
jgi:hypothetical protein